MWCHKSVPFSQIPIQPWFAKSLFASRKVAHALISDWLHRWLYSICVEPLHLTLLNQPRNQTRPMESIPCIDVFCHYLPPALCKAVKKRGRKVPLMFERASAIPALVDLETRFRVMDEFPGYQQIPSLASPPLELLAPPKGAARLARVANDAMAEMVQRHRDRFPGFVAGLPLNDPEAAVMEAQRAVRELGALGVQIYSNVAGRPLDAPEFQPLFETMATLERPIWLHPIRSMHVADYPSEACSRFDIWWSLGWPYETSAAMVRLVFSGLFDRCPRLRILTHHVGGMIPMMEGRLGSGMEVLGSRTPPEFSEWSTSSLREQPLYALRRFYADTASFGSRAAIECGMAFFGIEHMLFATDMPFDPEQGPRYIRQTLSALQEMSIPTPQRQAILIGNARAILELP
jgi:aminocarboxymuconate-semialdehyde decarboxylase